MTLNAHFDARAGCSPSSRAVLVRQAVRRGSDPRQTDEFLLGTAFQMTPRWSVRAYGRYREGSNFWEDVNNGARLFADAPPTSAPAGCTSRTSTTSAREIGSGGSSGSSYVIAELDGAYTKYHEATVESEWRGAAGVRPRFVHLRASTWGNFDQDNTTIGNDMNTFIGSSLIADGAGRQTVELPRRPAARRPAAHAEAVWLLPAELERDGGRLRRSRSRASRGKRGIARRISPSVGENSDNGMFVEPAGSRRSDSHAQLDLNYTQNIPTAAASSCS